MPSLASLDLAGLAELPPEVLAELRYRWDLWARPEQIPPQTPWSIYLDMGGVGSGKTRSASEWARSKIEPAEKNKTPICVGFVGRTAKDVRDVMVLGESGILGAYPGAKRSWYRSSHSKVVFPGGSEIIMLTAENPDAIRGFQFHFAWADEVALYMDVETTIENLLNRLRLGLHPQLFLTSNPRPRHMVPWLAKLLDDPSARNAVVRTSTTHDNRAFLPASYLENAERLAHTAFGRMEFGGEMIDLAGGLFQAGWIKYQPNPPETGTTYVAIDPAVRSNANNDETGIIVVRESNRRVYVLDDLSGHWTPEQWAEKAHTAAKRYKAQAIVAEVSRGYDTIVAVLRQQDRHIPIRQVQARASKDLRAVPVAALYEQGRVFHARKFEELEGQMVTFDPSTQQAQRGRKKATSPDRLDALVWGISEFRLHMGAVPTFKDLEGARLPSSYDD